MTQADLLMRPTSSYLCTSCKTQLFTNLDILIHEQTDELKATKKETTAKGKSRRNSKLYGDANGNPNEEQDLEIATIADFGKAS